MDSGGEPTQKQKKEIQIDIIGTSTNKNEFIIGSCKYRSRPIDTDEFELLQQYASAFGKESKYHYFIFSKSGFTEKLEALGSTGAVTLVTLTDMYR